MLCRCKNTGFPRVFSPTRRRHASFNRQQGFPSYFTRTPIARHSITRRALWLIPFAGGLTLYLMPQPKSFILDLISSPAIIPHHSKPSLREVHTVMSPSEEELRIIPRLLAFFRDRIWEPIRTTARFMHLAILFLPVIITSPMILVGSRRRRKGREIGDRWGALWWYDHLTKTMQAAGPTFIKVRAVFLCEVCVRSCSVSFANGLRRVQTCSQTHYARSLGLYTPVENHIPSVIQDA